MAGYGYILSRRGQHSSETYTQRQIRGIPLKSTFLFQLLSLLWQGSDGFIKVIPRRELIDK